MKVEEVSRVILDQFYQLSEREAKELSKQINAIQSYIEAIERHTTFKTLESNGDAYVVAAVDGSNASNPLTLLSRSYSIYAVTTVIHRPGERLTSRSELYRIKTSLPNTDVAKLFTAWRMLKHERETAKKIAGDVDIVVIDGSFYGFIYSLHRILKRYGDSAKSIVKIASQIYTNTVELIDIGNVLGVVKRARTISITPYLHLHYGLPFKPLLDRLILHVIQPLNTLYSYTEMYGSPWRYQVLNKYAKKYPNISIEKASEDVKAMYDDINSLLGGVTTVDEILNKTERIVLRHYLSTPVEIDIPTNRNKTVDEFLSTKEYFNPDTNLPLINDMADYEGRIPDDFNHLFAEEVEALLIKKYRVNPVLLQAYFKNLNPQKDIG